MNRLVRRALARAARDDAGFSMIELVVAMLVIAVVLTSLIAIQISSLKTVALAKQRQSATALADQKVERLRALPYDKLSAGLLASESATDTANVTSGRLRAPWDEKLVTSTNQTEVELNPHVATQQVGSVAYTVRTFVTLPKVGGVDSVNANDFWLTVLVDWSSSATGGKTKSVVVRNRSVFPSGCKGTVDHPYVGPCQAFLYSDAGTTTAGISIRSAGMTGIPPIPGIPFTTADIVLASMTSGSQIEQTTSARAEAVTGGVVVDDNPVSGQAPTSATSDIDPVTGATINPTSTAVPFWTAGTTMLGTASKLALTPASASSGNATAEVSSVASPACEDLSGTPVPDGQLCAAARYQGASTNRATLDLAAIGAIDPVDLGPMDLASIDAGTTPTRAYGSRFLAGNAAHCTGTGTPGCITAGVSRTIGAIKVGGLPAGAPSGFDGMLKISGYADSATSEAGISAATPVSGIGTTVPTASRFGVSRTGSISWWTGAGYSTATDLNTLTSTTTIPESTVAYTNNSTTVNVTVGGEVRVTSPSAAATNPANCQPDACVGKSSGGSLVATLTYLIASPTEGTIANFTVDVNLGSVVATSTYRAVPSA